MKLNLDILPFGRSEHPIEADYRLETGEGEPVDVAISGPLVVDNTEGRVLANGELEVRAPAHCDRCLEEFSQVFRADVELQIVRTGRRGGNPDQEPDEYGTWVIHQARGEVELDAMLSEAAQLARPQKRVCSEDCKGLCSVCGGNRNRTDCDCDDTPTDPRWDALPT